MSVTLLTVSIIVHNDFSHIAQALLSLYGQTYLPMTIYVTVNSGNADSINQLKQQFPQIHYLINDTPQGFAYNHNRVLRIAETEYVALLNDDVLVSPGMVERIIAFMSGHPKVGLASPHILNNDGTPQLEAFSDPAVLRMIYRISGLSYFTQHGGRVRGLLMRLGISKRLMIASLDSDEGSRFVPVVLGVAMFVRRAAYEQAGVMDEATLVYGEEYAWHWRIRQSGWLIAIVGDAIIIHHNEAQDLMGWKLAEHRKGILNYYVRYRPRWQALIIRVSIILFHSIRAVATALFDRSQSHSEWQTMRMALSWKPPRVNR